MKNLTKIITTALVLAAVAAPMAASASGISTGAKKVLSDGVTYGYAWTGYSGKDCYLKASIGTDSYEGWEDDWNQKNLECDGTWNIYHSHKVK